MGLSDDSVWDGQTRAAPFDTHHFSLCLLDHRDDASRKKFESFNHSQLG